MINGAIGSGNRNSLMGDYTSRLGDAILRQRLRIAEESARFEAELANKVKSEFISNMSHELRTPLNTIIGFSKIISESERRKLKEADVAEYSRMIQDAAHHLLAVINDILDISKLQAGRYTLIAEDVNLDEVMETVIASLDRFAADSSVTLHQRIDTDMQAIRGDAAKLTQALTNLVNNAIKFTPPEGSVSIDVSGQSDGGVVMSIRDTGVGMSEEELRIALMPFGQVDGARTRWREGTGLGLPIAKALIELHGGRVEIRSAKGMGTEVLIIMPSRHFVSVVGSHAAMQSNMHDNELI